MFDHLRLRFPKPRFVLCCALALVLICLSATTPLALDGLIDVRGYRQGGRAGETEYANETLWERYALDQRVMFDQSVLFQIRYTFQRENLWGSFAGNTSKSRRVTQGPFMLLTYRGETFRAGLTGNGLRKEFFVPGVSTRTDDNITSTIWANYDIDRADFVLRYLYTLTERTQGEIDNETRNSALSFIADVDLSANDRLQYSVNNTVNKGITRGTETNYLTNVFQYWGSHRFGGDRGRFNIFANANRFDQTNFYTAKGARQYIPPIWGGFLLDDTPGEQDPLEPDPTREPLLHDNDVVTATAINIGSDAPVVREFGGDYRNIILDFGDPTAMDSIALYIDTQINFPGLIQWLVYVSDDPEGRLWGEPLTPDVATVTYNEWELGRQGWEVKLASTLTQRRVKLVNVKFGVTEPDIFITEMEVFSPPIDVATKPKTTLHRFRFNGDIKYNILPDLEVNFSTDMYKQISTGGSRDLSGGVHQLGSIWRPNDWDVNAFYQVTSLTGTTRYETDVHAQFLSVGRRFNKKIDARVFWRRADDNSTGLNYTTNDVNLEFNWRIAPGLSYNQRFGRGLRTDNTSSAESESWVLRSTIRATPIRVLSLDLQRVDRWVSQYAGSGFSNFNNTELITRWSIMPYLAYHNLLVYQVRENFSDWSARNQLSWSPIPGGTMGISFNVVDYRDTRIDIVQQSAGVALTWQARVNVKMEFGAETVNVTLRGEKNRPTNLYLRGRMNF
jgi:hypothetical protein